MKEVDGIADLLLEFWAYRAELDNSRAVSTSNLIQFFSSRDDASYPSSVSTFAGIVNCPYRVVNLGLGTRGRLDKTVVAQMNAGTMAHRDASASIAARSAKAAAAGGRLNWRQAPTARSANAKQDLLEAPEVPVKIEFCGLRLNGKADGLLRTDGVVIAIERKPRSAMFRPESSLQAMTYAIGGCIGLGEAASSGASWIVTSYKGDPGPAGRITRTTLSLMKRLGKAFIFLVGIGSRHSAIPGLPGPSPGKCRRCEYFGGCSYRTEPTGRRSEAGEPIWVKYARRG